MLFGIMADRVLFVAQSRQILPQHHPNATTTPGGDETLSGFLCPGVGAGTSKCVEGFPRDQMPA
jgi:hypothetical protein